jgi:hypothetical protein
MDFQEMGPPVRQKCRPQRLEIPRKNQKNTVKNEPAVVNILFVDTDPEHCYSSLLVYTFTLVFIVVTVIEITNCMPESARILKTPETVRK